MVLHSDTSPQAKKRMSIDQRLQAKLTKEQTIVRQQDESKRDRINASRKLEDISIKDGIVGILMNIKKQAQR